MFYKIGLKMEKVKKISFKKKKNWLHVDFEIKVEFPVENLRKKI